MRNDEKDFKVREQQHDYYRLLDLFFSYGFSREFRLILFFRQCKKFQPGFFPPEPHGHETVGLVWDIDREIGQLFAIRLSKVSPGKPVITRGSELHGFRGFTNTQDFPSTFGHLTEGCL